MSIYNSGFQKRVISFFPQGTLGNVHRHFWLSQLGRGCYQHLVGRGQGGCSPSSNAQHSPPVRHYLPQDVNGVRLRNLIYNIVERIESIICCLVRPLPVPHRRPRASPYTSLGPSFHSSEGTKIVSPFVTIEGSLGINHAIEYLAHSSSQEALGFSKLGLLWVTAKVNPQTLISSKRKPEGTVMLLSLPGMHRNVLICTVNGKCSHPLCRF